MNTEVPAPFAWKQELDTQRSASIKFSQISWVPYCPISYSCLRLLYATAVLNNTCCVWFLHFLVQCLLWARLLRALLLLCFSQAGFFGVGSSRFWRVGFLTAVHGLGHRLSPATTAALCHPHPSTRCRVLPTCGCCFLQKKKKATQ